MGFDNVEGPYAPRAKLSHPDPGSYSTHDASGKLVAWKAKPVQIIDGVTCFQRADDGKWEKIWFPDGPPAYNACTEAAPELYDDKTRDAYLFAQEHGVFKDGWMPELPPLREWCRWDF
ncbi:MAG: hypothetical protein M1832_003479 [Thelocarpon impressellum]|nr:MAG: hypothetical protein M1832_003479 [Thelocarpon impressellum]